MSPDQSLILSFKAQVSEQRKRRVSDVRYTEDSEDDSLNDDEFEKMLLDRAFSVEQVQQLPKAQAPCFGFFITIRTIVFS